MKATLIYDLYDIFRRLEAIVFELSQHGCIPFGVTMDEIKTAWVVERLYEVKSVAVFTHRSPPVTLSPLVNKITTSTAELDTLLFQLIAIPQELKQYEYEVLVKGPDLYLYIK